MASASTESHRPRALPGGYDVVWDAATSDPVDSMPISGRGGAGANVWVQDSAIWLYLGHSGAFDEHSRLLKLGCVRLTPLGVGLGTGVGFEQRLDPSTGTVTIRQAQFGCTLWFAGQTLCVEVTSQSGPIAMEVAFGTWRDRDRTKLMLEMRRVHDIPADKVVADERGIVWWHRNADHGPGVVSEAAARGIDPAAVVDVLTGRVFGGAIAVEGGLGSVDQSEVRWQSWDGAAWAARTGDRARHRIAIHLDAALDVDPSVWRETAQAMLRPGAFEAAREIEQNSWQSFWARSHIVINPDAGPTDPGWLVGRNYQLFRYMMACNRGAEFPLLFSGGIFTVDNAPGRITGNNNDELPTHFGEPSTPDFRRWLYCRFMAQNQRWLGWPALASGDAELLGIAVAFYRDRAGVAAARARVHGAEGVCYPEPQDALGLCCVWPLPDGLCGAEHLTWHFSMMLEHAWMVLQAHSTLGISIDDHLSWVIGTVLFYDSYYRAQTLKRTGRELNAEGRLVLYPANGVEYAVGATNPIEVVAALARITEALLALPETPAFSAEMRRRMASIASTLPGLPVGERDGKRSLLPADSFEKGYNRWEPIEHYAAWPYRMVGVTRPETLQLARDTWDTIPPDRAALCKQDFSWMPNVANMAALGWADRARERVIWKLANTTAPQSRFPASFGPGHDWIPDFNWGGSGSVGLQEMLLAPEPGNTGKLCLLPAWPVDWDVDFRLHAPGQTVVEATVRGGRLVHLSVTPEHRRGDIVVCEPFHLPS